MSFLSIIEVVTLFAYQAHSGGNLKVSATVDNSSCP